MKKYFIVKCGIRSYLETLNLINITYCRLKIYFNIAKYKNTILKLEAGIIKKLHFFKLKKVILL